MIFIYIYILPIGLYFWEKIVNLYIQSFAVNEVYFIYQHFFIIVLADCPSLLYIYNGNVLAVELKFKFIHMTSSSYGKNDCHSTEVIVYHTSAMMLTL